MATPREPRVHEPEQEAQDVPEPPAPTLRERKKAAAMRHIQQTALELFTEYGFDQVTIEQIAATAEVSPSSVYRYFGTKEGLVLYDEFDDRVLVGLSHYLRQGMSPWEATEAALDLVAEAHFVVEADATRERVRLFFDNPSVRSAAYLVVDNIVDEMAQMMADTGRWSFGQGRVLASAIIWPFVAAIKNWHEDTERPWIDHLEDAIATMKEMAGR
ncbi:TetR/AcrR family transcriptional regulator [Georgenia deserti]|uniref:TetR/AcrR family transcriptional regulator n=1 Tax=Georgenia deserti TaxID=2093781 RepID=A0ABW4L8F5_9MICO